MKSLVFLFIWCPIVLLAEVLPIRVAVFEGDGVNQSVVPLITALQQANGIKFEILRITADEIQQGKLAGFDVLAHPGGSGGRQGKALGEKGRQAIRDFVRDGGGYLGVCAGAYLACNDYAWSLHLIDAKVVDKQHWARGKGTVKIQLSADGARFFGHGEQEMTIYYAQGPLLARREWDDPDVPDYESLAIYASEMAENGAPRGVMATTSAAVRCHYGRGRVFCFSPHPELTNGLTHLIPLSVRWLAGQEK